MHVSYTSFPDQSQIHAATALYLPTVMSVMIFFLRVPTIGATIFELLCVCELEFVGKGKKKKENGPRPIEKNSIWLEIWWCWNLVRGEPLPCSFRSGL